MPTPAAWLRLLVTTLLLVAGLARPVMASAQRGAHGDREPMQVAAATGHGELCRLSKRRAVEPGADAPAIVAELEPQSPRDRGRVAPGFLCAVTSRAARVGLVRVRGPPRW